MATTTGGFAVSNPIAPVFNPTMPVAPTWLDPSNFVIKGAAQAFLGGLSAGTALGQGVVSAGLGAYQAGDAEDLRKAQILEAQAKLPLYQAEAQKAALSNQLTGMQLKAFSSAQNATPFDLPDDSAPSAATDTAPAPTGPVVTPAQGGGGAAMAPPVPVSLPDQVQAADANAPFANEAQALSPAPAVQALTDASTLPPSVVALPNGLPSPDTAAPFPAGIMGGGGGLASPSSGIQPVNAGLPMPGSQATEDNKGILDQNPTISFNSGRTAKVMADIAAVEKGAPLIPNFSLDGKGEAERIVSAKTIDKLRSEGAEIKTGQYGGRLTMVGEPKVDLKAFDERTGQGTVNQPQVASAEVLTKVDHNIQGLKALNSLRDQLITTPPSAQPDVTERMLAEFGKNAPDNSLSKSLVAGLSQLATTSDAQVRNKLIQQINEAALQSGVRINAGTVNSIGPIDARMSNQNIVKVLNTFIPQEEDALRGTINSYAFPQGSPIHQAARDAISDSKAATYEDASTKVGMLQNLNAPPELINAYYQAKIHPKSESAHQAFTSIIGSGQYNGLLKAINPAWTPPK